ncbi:MAG: enoyl-CoA hydratase/isomerase family protein [Firmicutes bacterium]|nr:enoyl-CoA hydratase/isomerase family protein [Bacillota bacterium]
MGYEAIGLEQYPGGIAVIQLNRPDKRNAISIKMRAEFSECIEKLKDDPDNRLLIITGAGAAFSAGFDLSEFKQPERFEELFATSARYHRQVWHFPKPTIAAVNGVAMGGGFDLATLCDIRICSETAEFGHPEIKFGAPTIYTPLRWIIGMGLARDLCITGRRINAQEAYRIGLVSEVVAADKVLPRAIEIGQSILEAPMESLRFVKKYLVENSDQGFEDSFHVEHDRAFHEIILK